MVVDEAVEGGDKDVDVVVADEERSSSRRDNIMYILLSMGLAVT